MRPQLGLGFSSRSAAAAAPATPTNHVLNGTFPGDDTTNVGLQSPLNVSGGVLHMANTSGFTKNATFTTDSAPPPSTVCVVEFDVSNFVAAPTGMNVTAGGGAALTNRPITGNGHYSFSATSSTGTPTATLQLGSKNNSNFDVDNVTCTW